MHIILSVETRENKLIRLTYEQWKHIAFRHPEMVNRTFDIERTLKNPDYISEEDCSVLKYYKYIKEESKYLMVAVRILNGEGFVMTSYMTRRIKNEKEQTNY